MPENDDPHIFLDGHELFKEPPRLSDDPNSLFIRKQADPVFDDGGEIADADQAFRDRFREELTSVLVRPELERQAHESIAIAKQRRRDEVMRQKVLEATRRLIESRGLIPKDQQHNPDREG